MEGVVLDLAAATRPTTCAMLNVVGRGRLPGPALRLRAGLGGFQPSHIIKNQTLGL